MRLAQGIVALVLGSGLALAAHSPPVAAQDQYAEVASYELEAELDPAAKQVRGSGRITYRNASPDALAEVWIRLYLNAFRSVETPWMREAGAELRGQGYDPAAPGWIRLEQLSIATSGQSLPLPDPDTAGTIVRIPLAQPLGPGQTLELNVRWTSQLPRVFARTGFGGPNDDFFMVGQWYPKLAVYDPRRGGWDREPWHANAEFFADFGSYDLTLKLPADYSTVATGVQVGMQLSSGVKQVRYRAERVTDVAWAAARGFQTATRLVEVAGRQVALELLLPPREVPRMERHAAAATAALQQVSAWYGAYPWPKLTVVVPPVGAEGAGGMEYPMLVSSGSSTPLPLGLGGGVRDLETVTVHEVAHQWFPMQVQSNEAAEPWLDEGFADYLTLRLMAGMYGSDRSVLDLPFARLGYEDLHRANMYAQRPLLPLTSPSWAFQGSSSYASTIYSRGALALLSLEREVGAERMTGALRAYTDRWRWRHPSIVDLEASLDESLGSVADSFFADMVRGGTLPDHPAPENASPDVQSSLTVAFRWLTLTQAALRLLGQIG